MEKIVLSVKKFIDMNDIASSAAEGSGNKDVISGRADSACAGGPF